MLVQFCLVCSAPVLWQEAKTLAKVTLVDQSSTEITSSAPPHGVTDVQSETDPEFMLMYHITAAGLILNNSIKSSSKLFIILYSLYSLDYTI